MTEYLPTDGHEGAARLARVSWAVTVGFLVVSLLTWILAERLDLTFAIFCGLVFVAGAALFLLGFWNGVQRSRVDEVTLPGLLSVSTAHVPKRFRNTLWAAVLFQVVIAVAGGVLRPFSQQAFGLLVPMFGIGLAALWGSRFAQFFERTDP